MTMAVFCHLSSQPTPPEHSGQAGKIQRAAVCKALRIYLVLQLPGQTAPGVATRTGGPLPHLLTFTRRSLGEGGFNPPKPWRRRAVILFSATIPSRISHLS